MTMHVLESASREPTADELTLCCGRLVGDLAPGDDVTRNPIYYTCSDPGPSLLSVVANAIGFEMLRHDGRPSADGRIDVTGEEADRCRAAARRVLDHLAARSDSA
jgi:hypothetical protein